MSQTPETYRTPEIFVSQQPNSQQKSYNIYFSQDSFISNEPIINLPEINQDINKLTIPRKTLTISKDVITGGNCGMFPERVLIDLPLTFKNQNEYTIIDDHNKLKFKFHNNNKANNIDRIYFGCGTFTALYSIKLTYQDLSNNALIPDAYKDNLILRIYESRENNANKADLNVGDTDIYNDHQTTFINNWMGHKKLFPDNIIDIYLYGDIQLQGLYGKKYIGYYIITRKYIVEDYIESFSLNNKIKYLKNTIEFLKKLEDNNYTYRDMKFENSGSDENYNFIVIDYDIDTLLTGIRIKKLMDDKKLGYGIGTYPFAYLISDDQRFNYKYIYLSGLLDFVSNLFNANYNKTYIYKDIHTILLAIVNVYREYIKNYYYSGPVKKLLWYLSGNKKKYEDIKTLIPILFEHIRIDIYLSRNSGNVKDQILYELTLKFCMNCLVFSGTEIKPGFLNELRDYLISIESKPELHGGNSNKIYNKYLKYKNKYLKLKN